MNARDLSQSWTELRSILADVSCPVLMALACGTGFSCFVTKLLARGLWVVREWGHVAKKDARPIDNGFSARGEHRAAGS